MKFSRCLGAVLAALVLCNPLIFGYELVEDTCPLEVKNPRLQAQKKQKLILDNGVRVYLVSDPERTQSAASFAMGVGSWSDPKAYPGTAHFVEHLLFMGSHTYPDEGFFMESVDKAGGFTNAYTSTNRTVYGFCSDNEHFEELVSVFAHMFIDPLFNPDSIAREYKAVEQEYQLSLSNDSWRIWAALKDIGNPEHPHNTFNCGNSSTLSNIPVEEAISWYKNHYDPAKATLVMTSALPLETMMAIADNLFSQIKPVHKPSGKTSSSHPHSSIFDPEMMPCRVSVTPHDKEVQEMIYLWELPSHYKQKLADGRNAAHVVFNYTLASGHEKALKKQLKEANLITGISSFVSSLSRDHHLFGIDVVLTDKGVKERDKVTAHVDAYLKTLLARPVPNHFPVELATIWENEAALAAKPSAYNFCMDASSELLTEDLSAYPKACHGLAPFNLDEYHKLIEAIQLDKGMLVNLISPEKIGVTPTCLEKWYQVPYLVEAASYDKPVPQDISFTPFPEPNPYIASNMDIVRLAANNSPSQATWLINTTTDQLVYRKDDTFLLPTVALDVLIESPHIDLSAKSDLYLDLFGAVAARQLSSLNIQGNLAGLSVHVSPVGDGIHLSLSGFEEKSLPFFKESLDILTNPMISEESFAAEKEAMVASFNSRKFTPAYKQAVNYLKAIKTTGGHTNDTYLAELATIELEDFAAFIKNVLADSSLKIMVSGALEEEDAYVFHKAIREHKAFKKDHELEAKIIKKEGRQLSQESLPEKTYLSCSEKGSSALLMIQDEGFSFEKLASNYLLNFSLKGEFFDTLRTKQQTGYMASAFPSKTDNDIISHNFCVHSTTHSSEELLARYELFLEEFVANIEERISKEQFAAFKATLQTQILTPHETLESQNREFFNGLCIYEGDFNRREKLLKATQELCYEDFIAWSKALLSRSNHKRLAILVGGAEDSLDFAYVEKTGSEVSFKEGSQATDQA